MLLSWQRSIRETNFLMPSVLSADASWRLHFSASLLSICVCFHTIPVPWKHESYSVEIPNYLKGTWNPDMSISDSECPHVADMRRLTTGLRSEK
jgi:hypothetical protein